MDLVGDCGMSACSHTRHLKWGTQGGLFYINFLVLESSAEYQILLDADFYFKDGATSIYLFRDASG